MATTANLAGNYAGLKAAGYVAPMIKTADTLEKGVVTLHENVKWKLNVRNFDVTPAFADGSCTLTDAGQYDLSDTVLELKDLQIVLAVCRYDLYQQWEAEELSGVRSQQSLPRTFQDWLVTRLTGKIQAGIEDRIWTGTNTTGSFVGLESRLESGSTVVKQAGSTITHTNVVAEIAAAYDGMSDALDYNQVSAIVSRKTARLYQRALGYGAVDSTNINSYNNQLVVGEKPLDFNGMRIVPVNGISDDTIVIARPEDLHVGTNLSADWGFNGVNIVDLQQSTGEDKIRFITKLSLGTQITNGADIVYRRVTGS